jgi:uncharacterized membrane protein YphA (DoxX/SURF4 family)
MKNKILFALCLLTGLVFINSGLDKFLHYMPMPKDMPEKLIKSGQAFMEIGWILPLVGAAEIAGGILLIPGRTRALGAIVLIPVLAGILLSTISLTPSALPVVLVLLAIVLWVIIDNREKYLPMIRK